MVDSISPVTKDICDELALGFCTYNMHGFNNDSVFLKQLCLSNDIVFVQEHWHLNSHLHKFNGINDNFCFYGKSAMDSVQSVGLLRGRPFGGVGVLWRKSLNWQRDLMCWLLR